MSAHTESSGNLPEKVQKKHRNPKQTILFIKTKKIDILLTK